MKVDKMYSLVLEYSYRPMILKDAPDTKSSFNKFYGRYNDPLFAMTNYHRVKCWLICFIPLIVWLVSKYISIDDG
jgi:hypothetical protein